MDRIDRKSLLLLGVYLVLCGSYAAATKVIMRELDSYQMMFWLFLCGALTAPLVDFRSLRPKEPFSRREKVLLTLTAVFYFIYFFAYNFALSFIPAIEASMINYLFPITVVVFAVLFFKERLSARKVIAIVLGFLGVIYIASGGNLASFQLTNPLGDGMALLGAVSWGLFANLGRMVHKNPFFCNFYYILVGAALSFVTVVSLSELVLPSWKSLLLCLYLGFTNLSFGLLLWFKLLRTLPTTFLANATFITPFITIILLVLITGEELTMPQLWGGLLIFAAMLVQGGVGRRKKQREE